MLDKDKQRATTNRRVKRFFKNHPGYRKQYRQTKEEIKAIRRSMLLEVLSLRGTQCAVCGYKKNTAALEWHHLRDKRFLISQKLYTRNRKKLYAEIEKCILLCCNCHRELHNPQCKI